MESLKPSTIQSYSSIRFETDLDEQIDSIDLQRNSILSRHTLFDEDFYSFQTKLAPIDLISVFERQFENRPEEFFNRIEMFQILIDLVSFFEYFWSKILLISKFCGCSQLKIFEMIPGSHIHYQFSLFPFLIHSLRQVQFSLDQSFDCLSLYSAD